MVLLRYQGCQSTRSTVKDAYIEMNVQSIATYSGEKFTLSQYNTSERERQGYRKYIASGSWR